MKSHPPYNQNDTKRGRLYGALLLAVSTLLLALTFYGLKNAPMAVDNSLGRCFVAFTRVTGNTLLSWYGGHA